MSRSWRSWAEREADRIRAEGRWRTVRDLDAGGPAFTVAADGRAVVSFASNDYLGLSQHPAVRAAAHDAIDRWGTGAGSARLIVGSRPVHSELEQALAAWKGCERAALFPTGFTANLGVLAVLGGPGVTICSDERNHASIIDGCRLARAHVEIYRHSDVEHLASLLADVDGPAVVVTDTVFSMDGDRAPLTEIAACCAARGAVLVLDEAHDVLGPDGDAGDDLGGAEVVRVGTLSKTLGSLGGFVAGDGPLVDLVVNRARPFIFTTALTPADAAAALAAVRIVASPEGDRLRRRLRTVVERVRPGHPSPIVPVIVGDERAAVAAADALMARGLLVPAIRPPTVAPGTSRLRIALSAAHTDEQVATLLDALGSLPAFDAGVPA